MAKKQNLQKGQNTEGAEELLTVHEIATCLRVDDTTVRRWIKTGALDAITLPQRGNRSCYRVRKSTFDRVLNSSATRAS